ncbi:MAG: N-acetyltransferase [Desulfobacterales bacterium]|nr:N-acetyltransferase [Desulfobacterales bacterium]MDJ0886917.1 N-acetyltransferase [Desulfobacterales bacterium]
MAGIEIKAVEDRGLQQCFLKLPSRIYRADPAWVPPLLFERKQFLSPHNPYFEHARYKAWIAYRNGDPVGRVSAQIDQLHLDRYRDDTGFYGLLEAEDDPSIFEALFGAVESWLRGHGMRRVRGPFNLSINHECGMLVDGFQTPPMVMMGHARPYYTQRIEQQGYRGEVDLLAYLAPTDFTFTPAMQNIVRRYENTISVRAFQFNNLDTDLAILKDIYEDAWSQNWGFLPFTNKELKHLGRDLKQFVPEEFVAFAEIDGQPQGFITVFPNLYEAMRDLRGRLLPFGWLKLLWRLKTGAIKTLRVPLMGVRQKYHDSLTGAALALSLVAHVQQVALKRAYEHVEMSWILEDNKGMRNMIENIGGDAYKRYRIFTKSL